VVQRTGGIRRDLQAVFWLGVFSTSQAEPRPAHLPLTQTVRRLVRTIKSKGDKVMKKSIGSVFLAFVLLTVVLSGCAPASTPVPPTLTFTPIPPTDTPVPTATPTELPTVTPTPIVEPPSIATEFLTDVKNLSYDSFDISQSPYSNESNWIWDSQISKIANGVLEFHGAFVWAGEFSLKQQLVNGEGIIMKFKLQNANGDSELLFRAGDPGTDDYRQFGVWPNNYPAVDIWQPVYLLGEKNNIQGNLRLSPDTGYGLLMAIGKDAQLLAVMWDLADESNRVVYKETLGKKWMDRSWYFGGRADGTEAVYIDDIYVITFGEIK
jgi:hypothetical protein